MSRPNSTNSATSNTNLKVDVKERLRIFSEKSGCTLIQENGQRKYGPPPDWQGEEPPRGCEVFIGKLPRNMFEDEIIPVFQRVAKLYKFRLMMDFTGTNRGFAFAKYTNKNDAKKAVEQLDNYEIRKGKHIGVVLSVDNCRLYLGRIPRHKTCEEVRQEICKLTDGVVKVILYPNAEDRSKNRGFAFVEYINHQAATAARRKLIPGQVAMWNVAVEVDWAEPEQEPDEEIIAQVKNLYVRNLMPYTTEARVKEFFEEIAGKDKIEHVKKIKDYAFVHFKQKEDAIQALHEASGKIIDGTTIEVVWAKPVDRNLKRLKSLQMAASNSQNCFQSQATRAMLSPTAAMATSPNFGSYTVPATGQQFIFSGSSPNVSGPIIPSGTNLYTGASILPSNSSSPSTFGSLNASFAHLAGSANAVPYAGLPFIDPTAGGMSQSNQPQWVRMMNTRNRCAAGMRSAGYQNAITNGTVGRLRKKFTENLNTNDSLNGAITVSGSGGLILLPQPVVSFTAPLPTAPLVNAMTLPQPPIYLSQQPRNQSTDNGNVSPPGQQGQHVTAPVSVKGYCQMLEDYCQTNKFAQPEYQLTVTSSKDVMGNDVNMYVYKVIIPNLVDKYGQFERHDLSTDLTEAQEKAAQYVLLMLGYSFSQHTDQAHHYQQHAGFNLSPMIAPTRINSFQMPPPPRISTMNYPHCPANYLYQQRFPVVYQNQMPSPGLVQQNQNICIMPPPFYRP